MTDLTKMSSIALKYICAFHMVMALVLTRIMAFVLTALLVLPVINWSNAFALHEYCDTVDIKTLKCNFIPKDIPNGISSVRILDFKEQNKIFEVNSSHFESDNWGRLKSLELTYSVDESISSIILKSKCFHGLKNLQELHMHLKTGIILDPDAFTGLDALKMLDMSRCVRLSFAHLVPSLNGKHKLPNLENLKLSELNFYREPNVIDTSFARALEDKNITSLDVSYTKLTDINITALITFMNKLKNINVSFSTVAHVTIDGNIAATKFEHIHVLDFSYIFGSWIIPFVKIFNQTWNTSDFSVTYRYLPQLFAPKIVNTSAYVPDSVSLWIMNCTMNVDTPLHWRSEEVIIRQNNIKYLDVKMQCNIYAGFTIKHIDLAQNSMEFLHPSFLGCFPNLERLDLSSNQLYKMVQEHRSLFEKLTNSLHRLRLINLSTNLLKSIPENILILNHDLEKIDLSHNDLDQVTFTIQHLEKLKVLDLQYNRIKILNGISINNLDSINTRIHKQEVIKPIVQLEFNPISCSKCDAKKFLHWLTNTKSVNISTSDLICVAENGYAQKVDHHTLELVQGICNKKIIIISSCASVGLFALIAVVTMAIIYKYRNWLTRKANRIKFLNKLQEGHDQYEFVAFLSHSSNDKDFVDNYLMDKLNENLQLMTGIDRNLVCTGDLHFRPGFLIVDETAQCIERVSAFIVVVSDSYCTSSYCHNEVDLAYRLNKPIILMMKGHVDENLMMPTMRMLFKSSVRVLWTMENNEYILKTTWENVCKSVLDLITQNGPRKRNEFQQD